MSPVIKFCLNEVLYDFSASVACRIPLMWMDSADAAVAASKSTARTGFMAHHLQKVKFTFMLPANRQPENNPLVYVPGHSDGPVSPLVHLLRTVQNENAGLFLEQTSDRLTAQPRQSGHFQNGVGLRLRHFTAPLSQRCGETQCSPDPSYQSHGPLLPYP